MLYVGLDFHLRKSTFCVLDDNGKRLFVRDLQGSWIKIVEALRKVKEERKEAMWICYEASCGYGHLHDRLREFADRVVVAHPGQLRLIFQSKRKNDRVDAGKLAKLLFLDEVPPVYVPDQDVRAWRSMIEYRSRLVQKRTRTKNEIGALLREHGVGRPRGLWHCRGRSWLKSLELPDQLSSLKRSMLLDELYSLDHKISEVQKMLNLESQHHPGVAVLKTIPGIGPRTAECLVAYIDEADRFGRSGKVASYFGLVPSQDASAGRNRLGHITKQGPATARGLLIESAWVGVRRSPKIRAYYERIMKGDPDRRKIAIVATAHYLLRVALCLLKTGEVWDEAA